MLKITLSLRCPSITAASAIKRGKTFNLMSGFHLLQQPDSAAKDQKVALFVYDDLKDSQIARLSLDWVLGCFEINSLDTVVGLEVLRVLINTSGLRRSAIKEITGSPTLSRPEFERRTKVSAESLKYQGSLLRALERATNKLRDTIREDRRHETKNR